MTPWQHPVFLLDVPFRDLEGIVEFIYHGEVSVDQECLESFLKSAQMLRVKGLTDEQGGANTTSSGGGNTWAASGAPHQNGVGKSHHLGSAGEEEDEDDEDEEEEELEEKPGWKSLVRRIQIYSC